MKKQAAIAFLLLLVLPPIVAQSPHPAPGKLVDVGGHRVHLNCTGQGSPTVMIVGGGFSFDWDLVQTQTAKITQVCTYDVSGTAWSDPGPLLTCSVRIHEIHALLKNAGVTGPYILVGLSIGAVVARRYAVEYPEEVSGIVMVDHAFTHPVDDPKPGNSIAQTGLDSPPVLISKVPIVLSVEDTSNFNNLPARDREFHRWAMSLGPALPTPEDADACLAEVEAATRGRNAPLGLKPLAVVSTGNVVPNYLKLQTTLLSLSRRSRQFVAEDSFHSVEIDQPEVVTNAIRWVVDFLR
jgi:pimeloyl-ACP methyl ester carboxylesterase